MTEKAKTFWKQVLEVGQIIVWVGACLFGGWMVGTGFGNILGNIEANGTQITEHQTQLDDHEQRLRTVEQNMHQVVTDVRWIRETLEKNQRNR